MVEFCTNCGAALPKGDVTIRGGELFTSHDYVCPNCNNVANPLKGEKPVDPEPDQDHDVVISDGNQQKE
jgi:hypothetical protein